MSGPVVIVGAGQAGLQLAASLRQEGWQEAITLVGDEPHLPYQRPPLSKGFLLGKTTQSGLFLRSANFFSDQSIDLLVGERAAGIDVPERKVRLASGGSLSYGSLVLATGTRPRMPPIPGIELDGVLALRGLDDAARLRERLEQARSLVVIGGGFIGLELAAVAVTQGKDVTVVEAASRPMARVVAPEMSAFYAREHQARGIRLLCGSGVARIEGALGRVTGVVTSDNASVPADVVVVGIGVQANDELAVAAGLSARDGVVVDALLGTGAPGLFAIGDCVRAPHPAAPEPIRIESVQNAVDQAKAVAASIVGKPAPYAALPWFWSDQYDLKLQIAGLSHGHETTQVLGDPEARRFSLLYFRDRRLIAVDSVNRPGDHMAARRLLSSGMILTPDTASMPAFELKAFVQGGGGA
ncbi:NAD(P)/FAD-dependent oxidoreductase [Marinivivus vitaminiproducens]|uniref:NAD(P)/FAD-dependent oxidoreductase n=1 Tax=Marinivivus vitaminiproducens TaxID=3035935 RepID=UPI003F9F89AE